ncbi:tRNA (adenosine(37)-N6)-threonylcarbamoyltransferase complex dimerization subunit type 1 TsaB [Desmospora profundinema]|uniref:tRNA threonylcarbamoyladenosine biosynthesis protein TsaB n=1 Tax=Desmospora profundinema TaxID=1571184 RepID=A0ABU1IRV9_9BACL|nr:tRNA (adenosine(37)-N6)-threonylcarbamoyltransferase complex dimerization subunit type 1 TsaB [Desmospora profundinema]MDR6227536.1 tRNA threonylcarbamoyladenosine biosynthesis protein TsaB [Desmospora profundinema]
MKILALDTSTLVLGVAVLDHNRLLGQITTNLHKNHSIRLMPTVSLLLRELDLEPKDMDAIAVAEGPGSYTGVRIGFTTAKTMAWSLDVPLVPVSSLAALAMNGKRFPGGVIPLFDARRNRVYTGWFRGENGRVVSIVPERVIAVDHWLDTLKGQGPFLFLGDDAGSFRSQIEERLGEEAVFGSPAENTVQAAHLGWLAKERIRLEEQEEAMDAAPNYLQLTEAETKWLKTRQNGVKPDGPTGC